MRLMTSSGSLCERGLCLSVSLPGRQGGGLQGGGLSVPGVPAQARKKRVTCTCPNCKEADKRQVGAGVGATGKI